MLFIGVEYFQLKAYLGAFGRNALGLLFSSTIGVVFLAMVWPDACAVKLVAVDTDWYPSGSGATIAARISVRSA